MFRGLATDTCVWLVACVTSEVSLNVLLTWSNNKCSEERAECRAWKCKYGTRLQGSVYPGHFTLYFLGLSHFGCQQWTIFEVTQFAVCL